MAAAATDEETIPIRIPKEDDIAIAPKLIDIDSRICSITVSGGNPMVKISINTPTIMLITVAIIKQEYTAKNFAKRILRLFTGRIKNKSYTCLFFSFTIVVLSITEDNVPPILATTSPTRNEIGSSSTPAWRKCISNDNNGIPNHKIAITLDL